MVASQKALMSDRGLNQDEPLLARQPGAPDGFRVGSAMKLATRYYCQSMASFDEGLKRRRLMWTFRSFVWGLRFMMIAFVLAIPTFAFRWEPLVPCLVMLTGGGLVLGIPFRVWAYWKLDIPYTTL